MKSKLIIIPLILTITLNNVIARANTKARPAREPKDSQSFVEEISIVSYKKCHKDILDLKHKYKHFNEMALNLNKVNMGRGKNEWP
jgi:hypothetical protein